MQRQNFPSRAVDRIRYHYEVECELADSHANVFNRLSALPTSTISSIFATTEPASGLC